MSAPLSDRPLLDVRRLTKVFGQLRACDAVDLVIAEGEIHALLGENGAGKSTFVKMLFGALQPLEGEIVWKGERVTITQPGTARKLGIGMVFQHFSLFDSLTAAENIALSLDGSLPLPEVAKRAREIGKAYGLPIDPQAHVGDLSVGERQRIEIVRCLLQEPDLIILDEPTSVLTPQEADRLFETLERLKSEGKSILYISHRLEEVKRLCDRATVLRHGKVVAHCDPREQTAASLARMMVGNDIKVVARRPIDVAETAATSLFEIKNLSQAPRGPFSTALNNISLSVKAGEVVGIAGVAGNGQGEFFEAVSGEFLQSSASAVRIRGKDAGKLGISERRLMGAAFVPEERLGHGAVPSLPLTDNLFLSRYKTDAKAFLHGGKLKLIAESALRSAAKRIIETMDVRKSAENPPASALSGGNLQKFIIGRELDRSPSVMVVNQPTWGVDAGAAAHIRQALLDLARSGSAVLVISQDLDELLEISDRIAVMNHGALSDPMPIAEVTLEKIGLLMGGVSGTDQTGAA
ncbi:ABC transporter ATP-binding protein [Ochrobactrum sp. MYb15]|uniref:ABC transporter ATP-binding protein n=1 Tax=Brucella TaxID=234 RepID=UPI00046390FE|nr:ABC transporter ATP-binding protein [Brucella rhizosphaerae]PQZ50569.1 ABC transporter ATP-binding protein [Ochrobactrum sp. MYb19]PRA55538.1 ABC transporter ATP-binding protein [Ochrobactrum sp. MYb68]PRA68608.1 ABC transporter ATP-binding protein [Ochrobactrum sp. MYb18]PRA74164.1 ABC transporter ATP-binding protein [Brucella thiophenivorans]PRA90860.1 ABC transporter ATP-binding protein [Ochrobactrum sp. MYb14]PRA96311.1 ABC transporter ATP-binding protein [Ochrobactrum sp. MYb15]